MRPFTTLDSLVLPIQAASVDTDILVPKQYLKRVERTGLADYLFDPWRYADEGRSGDPYIDCRGRELKSDFVLNRPELRKAQIMLTGANFGCGSSREQAPWALAEWGIRALIAPSFGDIFYNNCLANGLLPIVLGSAHVDTLFEAAQRAPLTLHIDLPQQQLRVPAGATWSFDIDPFRKDALLQGHDAIARSLQHSAAVDAFEQARFRAEPWLRHAVPSFSNPSSSES